MSRLVAWWPPWLVLAISYSLAFPLTWLPWGRLRAAHGNLSLVWPAMSFSQRQKLLWHCVAGWLATGIELYQVGVKAGNPQRLLRQIQTEGLDHLDKALRQGHGVILLSAHMGNFPWFVLHLAMRGYPVTVLYKEQSALPVHFFRNIMNRFGVEGLAVKEGRSQATRWALRALRHGRILFIHMDQGRRQGETVRFLGQMVQLPAGPAVLAAASGAPCLPAMTWRTGRRHIAHILPPLELAPERSPQAMKANMQIMASALEQAILDHPAQWLWMHRLFKWGKPCGSSKETSLRGIS